MKSILDDLKMKRDKLRLQLKIIERTITDLELVSGDDESKEEPDSQTIPLNLETPKYKPEWSMRNKVKFLLKQKNRFLHATELAKLISEKDSKDVSTRQVSVALNRLWKDTQKDKIRILNVKHGDDRRNTFWGKSTWLTTDLDRPKHQHMYGRDYLWENRKEEISIE